MTIIDARGPRFSAGITLVVLSAVLVAMKTNYHALALGLLIMQSLAFGSATFFGLMTQPYGMIYRKYIRPHLAKGTKVEDGAPVRFAQGVGFLFASLGVIALALNHNGLAYIAVGFAFVAAFLNAALGFCLGCWFYQVCPLPGKPISSLEDPSAVTVESK
jgi:hypothetical protein